MTLAGSKCIVAAALMSLAALRAPAARAQAAASAPPETPPHEPTAAELSAHETVGTALMRTFGGQEFEFRSAAEAMPEDKYSFRPAMPRRVFGPPYGPSIGSYMFLLLTAFSELFIAAKELRR